MYSLEELKDGDRFVGVRILHGNRTVAELKGGISLVIATQFAAAKGATQRQQDMLNGMVLAMSHCAITGQVPVAMVG
jgi:hypothetical protein